MSERLGLSERQQRLAATAVTLLSLVVILAAAGAALWAVAAFLRAFSHIFLPLAVAGVAALVFRPYFDWLRRRARLPAPLALAAFFLSLLIPLVAFAWFFGALLVDQISQMAAGFPAWWEKTRGQVEARWPRVQELLASPLGERLRQAAEAGLGTALDGLQVVGGKALSAGAGVVRGVGVLFSWAVTPVYLIFFLLAPRRDVQGLGAHLPFLKEDTRKDVVFLATEFVNLVVAFFRGQILIALMQGALFAAGFTLVGLRFGLVLGLLLGLLNIIPFLGSVIGLGIALPLAFFQDGGGAATLAGVLVVFVVVQLIEGYVLTPRVMGSRTGLHPLAIIVAVLFWGSALGGILGMILAIPLTAFLVVCWRLAREKYIEEWV